MMNQQKHIKKQINKLAKCMDFTIAKADSKSKDRDTYYDIYQFLGAAWEWLAKDCEHEFREYHDTTRCHICGKISDKK